MEEFQIGAKAREPVNLQKAKLTAYERFLQGEWITFAEMTADRNLHILITKHWVIWSQDAVLLNEPFSCEAL